MEENLYLDLCTQFGMKYRDNNPQEDEVVEDEDREDEDRVVEEGEDDDIYRDDSDAICGVCDQLGRYCWCYGGSH